MLSKQKRKTKSTNVHESAKDDDSQDADMIEVEDLAKLQNTPVMNAHQTQKNEIKDVANNDEIDTADAMSELEDLSENKTAISKECTTGKKFCYSGTEEDEEPYK